jgi:hypothetical protein
MDANDTLVVGVHLTGLLPVTYHVAEVRAQPSLMTASPPVLLRVGGFSDATGCLTISSGWPAAPEATDVVAIFSGQHGPIEAVIYRCYDGPAGDDTSFVVARGGVG